MPSSRTRAPSVAENRAGMGNNRRLLLFHGALLSKRQTARVLQLAAEFQKARGDEYLAGLWKRRLLEYLTWRRATTSRVIRPVHPVRGPMSRPTVYCCPSWPWMAIDGPVAFGSFGLPVVRDVKCTVTPLLSSAPFGAVTSGSLELSGRLTPVVLAFEPDKKRHLLENGEADKLLRIPDHDGAAEHAIANFLPDVPDEIDWGHLYRVYVFLS
jgi:hypothetical protein